ncbi:MAG: hypothetical protein JJE35_04885 [Thermoleophilia bacterium]|nr:hypothetical protein [Thermoleophilia bacterium]
MAEKRSSDLEPSALVLAGQEAGWTVKSLETHVTPFFERAKQRVQECARVMGRRMGHMARQAGEGLV